jgi:protease I
MQANTLNGLRVAILANDDFEQVELVEPRKALEQAGASTRVISATAGQIQGMNHDVKADFVPVDLTLDQANPHDFDALLLPGGALNADSIRMLPEAQEFVRQIDRSGKPIACICHAPWLLISARLVIGKTMTSWPTIQDDIRNAGASWVDSEMVRDGTWVSSRGPQDIAAFNRGMIELFSGSKVSTR